MIDLRDLREKPDVYRQGAAAKQYDPGTVDRLLAVDEKLRLAMSEREQITAEKNRIGKEIGQIAGLLKKAEGDEKSALQEQMKALQARPNELKPRENELNQIVAELEPQRNELWLEVPRPPDPDVPAGTSPDDNVEISRWNPDHFDTSKSFAENRGFESRSHIDLMQALRMVDFERGVKMAGTRSYVLVGDGMRLHQAILRCAFEYMTTENGFTPISVPTLVRDEMMVGTGFFPDGRDQAYAIANPTGEGGGLSMTGTAEVGLMGYHADEILDFDDLPRTYTSVSTCYRREAGAAGKDTAGLFRIHQFDKVEQVVICKADEGESRRWHQKMIGFVETLMQRLALPYRLLQCCTADLGPKNADQIDIEAWMPSRGEVDDAGRPRGAYGETHSASRLYDYQCRRLNLRYRDPDTNKPVVAHALNNTVAASPRILVPIIEMYQNEDGSVTVPEALRPYMQGRDRLG